jgi:hypothetical protein
MKEDPVARFNCLVQSIQHHFKEQELTDAFVLLVNTYFEEYEDATELDPQTYAALEHVFDYCFFGGEDSDGRTFEDVANRRPAQEEEDEEE